MARYKKNQTEIPEELEAGEASRRLAHEMMIAELPPINRNDPNEVNGRLKLLFDSCIENDLKPTVPSMCNALGITRNTLRKWFTGEVHKSDEVMKVIEKYYSMLNAFTEGLMYDGKINPVVGVWVEKNHWEYKDVAETIVKHENLLGMQQSAEDIRQKYLKDTTKSLPTPEDCTEVVEQEETDGQKY